MRKLTKTEIDNKPPWANSYDIQAQSDTPIFYAGEDGGAMPIPGKDFERLRNFIFTQRQEIIELKVVVEVLLSAIEEGFNSGKSHDLDAWEDKTKALIKELRKGNEDETRSICI